MNVAELKQAIQYLPDETPVGGVGHFGEFLEVIFFEVRLAETIDGEKVVFNIAIEDAGEEPD